MKEDLIDILAPPAYIHESGNRAAKPISNKKSLVFGVFLEIHHENAVDRDLDEYFDKRIKTSRK